MILSQNFKNTLFSNSPHVQLSYDLNMEYESTVIYFDKSHMLKFEFKTSIPY
jgi:hypothetical protein